MVDAPTDLALDGDALEAASVTSPDMAPLGEEADAALAQLLVGEDTAAGALAVFGATVVMHLQSDIPGHLRLPVGSGNSWQCVQPSEPFLREAPRSAPSWSWCCYTVRAVV